MLTSLRRSKEHCRGGLFLDYLKRLLANARDQKAVGPRRTALVYRFLYDRDIADEEAWIRHTAEE